MQAFLVIFLFILCFSNSFSQYADDELIIKVSNGSQFHSEITKLNSITALIPLIGKHTIQNYISPQILNLNKKNTTSVLNNSKLNELSLIFRIKYQKNVSPLIISKKISNFKDVIYCEPMPLNSILNDEEDKYSHVQWYMDTIRVFDAWDISNKGENILIGIVDTGIDIFHEDLNENIYFNIGETGFDINGNDKSKNLIDDDNNGFVDDYAGWDFSVENGDNSPFPGHHHGTHIAGISSSVYNNGLGIAGIAPKSKILPIKVASDDSLSSDIINGYDGILYAGMMGVDIINCSWGSTGNSIANSEIIKYVQSLGAIIVAAAGNQNSEIIHYPAGYDDVISVAAVSFRDYRASFTNYGKTVDVSSPGTNMFSTVPYNKYTFMNGTSMATPVISATLALVKNKFPQYNNKQLIQQVISSGKNISNRNSNYFYGKLGQSRVDVYNAVSKTNLKAIKLNNIKMIDENKNSLIENNERFNLSFELENILSPISNMKLKLITKDTLINHFIIDEIELKNIGSGEKIVMNEKFIIQTPLYVPNDYTFDFFIYFIENDTDTLGFEMLTYIVNPSFKNIENGDIKVTVNSTGNLAFNDFPNNYQGIGLKYKNFNNSLFEGALMIGVADNSVSNSARGFTPYKQDKDFNIVSPISFSKNLKLGYSIASSIFRDYKDRNELQIDSNQIGFDINSHYIFPSDFESSNYFLILHEVINNSNENFDSLFIGYFFDWDIGENPQMNIAKYNSNLSSAVAYNTTDSTSPIYFSSILSEINNNFCPIINSSTAEDSIGLHDGFTRSEKWKALSSGILSTSSEVSDISIVHSCGPIKSNIGDTTRIFYLIGAAKDENEMAKTLNIAKDFSSKINLENLNYNNEKKENKIFVFPNPLNGNVKIYIEIGYDIIGSIELYNTNGQLVKVLIESQLFNSGSYVENIVLNNLPIGAYYIVLNNGNENVFTKIIIE